MDAQKQTAAAPEGEMLSIVVPCYNEEGCIDVFLSALEAVELPVKREIVFIDDGSSDGTLGLIKSRAASDPRIRFVSFSRNFGKEAALLAGLRNARGDYVVTMDADLQDPPSLLPDMLEAVRNGGYDCAATRRADRCGEPLVRSLFARLFYWLMSRCSDVALVDGARDFRLMKRHVADAIVSIPEVERFTKGICQWAGFKTLWLEFGNVERSAGATKWPFLKLCAYAVDGMIAFSTAPLQFSSLVGCIGCMVSLCALVFVVVRKLAFGDPVAGWTSLVCIIMFFDSMVLFFLGILGLYLAKVYRETKRRPPYLVRETG